ncbi:MAG: dihydroorotate dehydrogenase electron transfer subunit [Gammaproteobacteria bacterium]|nr:MAG: dihydroorotate dehydrogenase electron transfer subunit [Gammaproteobacteria bacterium]
MLAPHRNPIHAEFGEILCHHEHPGGQYLLRVMAPACAAVAEPGQFAHIRVTPERPMRRPLSLLRAAPGEGWVEFLYKVVGEGTALLAGRQPGDFLDLLGPIGRPFQPHPEHPRQLLVGGGVGIPPILFLAERIREREEGTPVVFMGSELPFPFLTTPSALPVPGLPEETDLALQWMEDLGIASRLASRVPRPGVHRGLVTELARDWLAAQHPDHLREVEIFACGPHPMLAAVAELAREFGVPCQVSLEEFMACGVGGCAGCAVPVNTPEGPAMKRVCVDGPVFEAREVFGP